MRLKVFLFTIIMVVSATSVSAKGFIFYSTGEDVVKVLDLPQRDEFTIQATDGKWYHANLGILHEQFSIFGVPLYNYGTEKYVIYTDTKVGEFDYTYADLDKDEIAYLQSEFGGIPSKPELPFWDAWGGKLAALAVLALIILAKAGD